MHIPTLHTDACHSAGRTVMHPMHLIRLCLFASHKPCTGVCSKFYGHNCFEPKKVGVAETLGRLCTASKPVLRRLYCSHAGYGTIAKGPLPAAVPCQVCGGPDSELPHVNCANIGRQTVWMTFIWGVFFGPLWARCQGRVTGLPSVLEGDTSSCDK